VFCCAQGYETFLTIAQPASLLFAALMESHVIAPRASVVLWLRCCLVLVFAMVAIGGLTRLTESGLSIVEWKLVSGTFPPLSDAAWEEEFRLYQSTPEFTKKNAYMNVSDFKRIFWLEYLHRLLGRVIGLAFLLPLIWFSVRKALPTPLKRSMWGVFGLVCLQGAVGWYMVKSGLVNDPWVSPPRLAFHLCLATLIFGRTYWLLVRYLRPAHVLRHDRAGWVVLTLIMLQIMYGAFVAGLDAGMVYNSFPLMGGQFLPPEPWHYTPWVYNLFEHIPTVQFIHRWFAFAVFAAILWQWLRYYDRGALLVAVVACVQVVLGVATLLSVVAIPLASLHQLVAIVLVLVQLRYIFRKQSLQQ
jgi:heme a synthase